MSYTFSVQVMGGRSEMRCVGVSFGMCKFLSCLTLDAYNSVYELGTVVLVPMILFGSLIKGPFQIATHKGKLIPCIEHFQIAFKFAKCPNKDCLNILLVDPFFVC